MDPSESRTSTKRPPRPSIWSAISTIRLFGRAIGRWPNTLSMASRSETGPSKQVYMISAAAVDRLTPASQWIKTLPAEPFIVCASSIRHCTSDSVGPSSAESVSPNNKRILLGTFEYPTGSSSSGAPIETRNETSLQPLGELRIVLASGRLATSIWILQEFMSGSGRRTSVDRAARFHSTFAAAFILSNTLPPLHSNEVVRATICWRWLSASARTLI